MLQWTVSLIFFIRHQHSKVRLIVIKHFCVNFPQRSSITWKTIFWSYRRSSLIKIAKCDVTQKFPFILFCWFSLINLHFLSAKLSSSSSCDFSSHYLHCIWSSSSSTSSSSPNLLSYFSFSLLIFCMVDLQAQFSTFAFTWSTEPSWLMIHRASSCFLACHSNCTGEQVSAKSLQSQCPCSRT